MIIKSSKFRFLILLTQFIFANYHGKRITGKPLSFCDFLTPYVLKLDSRNCRLIIQKRNWYLIGVDRKVFNFGQIRNVLIDEHILLGDITIQVYAGKLYCYWMKKSDLRDFEAQLLKIRSNGADFGIVFDE